jgi:uncharacterized protein with von Willebrand factor type A (vWA) domain
MFTNFFYALKEQKVPVSVTEWMTLMETLSRGYIHNLDEFYFLARAILVKSEAYFDQYDVAFQAYFNGIETTPEISDDIWNWLKDTLERLGPPPDRSGQFDNMDLEQLMKEFEKRLQEQTEQHDGGHKWIGRGGNSPFGHSGYHPAGVRVGGESHGRHAVKIAAERRFRAYRSDITLDVRQMKLALKGLRQLTRIGPEDELDIDETIQATADNAGEIELVWQRRRKNSVKVLLLMDVGGSMEPFALLCSQLFSAAHSSSHFKDFRYYYFHNCIYDNVYKDIEWRDAVSTEHLLRTLEPDYKVLLVGDARMGPWELTARYGAINYYENNEIPGAVWLKRLSEHFTHRVWLNPDEERYWAHPTVQLIGKLFPMFPLSLDGLGQAVRKLVVKK